LLIWWNIQANNNPLKDVKEFIISKIVT